MKIMVTGAAGFIGSHLCEFLLNSGKHEVIGIDAFVRDELKIIGTKNIEMFHSHSKFTLVTSELLHTDWDGLLQGNQEIHLCFHFFRLWRTDRKGAGGHKHAPALSLWCEQAYG